jgi:hypothetical protein
VRVDTVAALARLFGVRAVCVAAGRVGLRHGGAVLWFRWREGRGYIDAPPPASRGDWVRVW